MSKKRKKLSKPAFIVFGANFKENPDTENSGEGKCRKSDTVKRVLQSGSRKTILDAKYVFTPLGSMVSWSGNSGALFSVFPVRDVGLWDKMCQILILKYFLKPIFQSPRS